MKNNPRKIRTIFLGTPEFSLKTLEAIILDEQFEVVLVISQPDKPVGRRQILTEPPIKELAKKFNLPVYQPEKIRTEVEKIKELKPDLIIVAAYGQIIPKGILDLPKYGCINVHGSLLPKYRGAACLQAPILHGDRTSGITIMRMDEGLDTGPILAQKKIKLVKHETLESLHDRLAEVGAKLLIKTVKRYIRGKIKPKAQNNKKASYIKMLKKEDGYIDWHKPATEIEKMIRAFNPWPGTFSYLSDKDLQIKDVLFKILAVRPKPIRTQQHHVGQLFLYNDALAVQCGKNALVIIKLQLEGKKAMEVDDFLRGNQIIIGQVLK
jgi:methionyl-tRNA formyltransferase